MKHRWVGNISLLIVSVVAGFFFVELGLRAGGISYPSFHVVDKHRGAALRAGAEGWWNKEGRTYVRINSGGLRDREHVKVKPSNTLRIAVLGDSYAEALQVDAAQAFWAVLERRLAKCDRFRGRSIEVINFGVSGYGTAQELLTLRHHVQGYDPDIILLAFFVGNDVQNNSRALERDPMRPYFLLQDGELVLDDSFLGSKPYRARQSWLWQMLYGLINYSRLLQVVNEAKNVISNPERRREGVRRTRTNIQQEPGLDDNFAKEPISDEWKDAWAVTEALLIAMHNEVNAKGAELLVVTVGASIQVDPDPETRTRYMRQLQIDDLFYPDRRIKRFGKRQGMHVLNLSQPFQSYAEKHSVYLHGFENTMLGNGHWNVDGHRLAGDLIAEKICTEIPL